MRVPQFLLNSKSIALILLLFGYAWILFTDFLVADLVNNIFSFLNLQLYKGFFFITIASAGLYLLLYIRDKKLADNRRYIDAIAQTISVGILVIDDNGTIDTVNSRLLDIMGYSRNDLIGKPFTVLIEDENEERALHNFEKLKKQNKLPTNEWKIHNKDGIPLYILLNTNPLLFDDQRYFIISATDITSQKETQKKLEQSLEEQRVLMSEIHHRVKNNLAIISGLMQLQVFEEDNLSLIQKLKAGVTRIQTIGSIHELLYQSTNLAELRFDKSIRALVDNLADTYNQPDRIRITLNLEDIFINVNQAVPACLIINELVANALQHAFTTSQKGQVRIELSQKENQQLMISVSDDGQGLPDHFNSLTDHGSLGFQLISTLLTQLEASHQITSTNEGTTFSITFSKATHKGSSNTFVN